MINKKRSFFIFILLLLSLLFNDNKKNCVVNIIVSAIYLICNKREKEKKKCFCARSFVTSQKKKRGIIPRTDSHSIIAGEGNIITYKEGGRFSIIQFTVASYYLLMMDELSFLSCISLPPPFFSRITKCSPHTKKKNLARTSLIKKIR